MCPPQVFHNCLTSGWAGGFLLWLLSPWAAIGMIHAGAEEKGTGLRVAGGCFCLWKRGRKRRLMPLHGVRCWLACVGSVSKKPPASAGSCRCPSSSRPCFGEPSPSGLPCRDPGVSPTPWAAFPKGFITVQVLQKGEIFERAGSALRIKIPCKCWQPRRWWSVSASHRQGHGSQRLTASPRVRGETQDWCSSTSLMN